MMRITDRIPLRNRTYDVFAVYVLDGLEETRIAVCYVSQPTARSYMSVAWDRFKDRIRQAADGYKIELITRGLRTVAQAKEVRQRELNKYEQG